MSAENTEHKKLNKIKGKFRSSILTQVVILFVIAIILIGICTNIMIHFRSNDTVKSQTEEFANSIDLEISSCIKEYQTYPWLFNYWAAHAGEMDIEYDAEFESGTKTEEKCRLLQQDQPSFQIKYATMEDLNALPAKDQKLYAEIVYSWLITRINEIKLSYSIDFLFCLQTDDSFDYQFFLLSAGGPDAERGEVYGQIYTLGVTSSVSEDQHEAMRKATQFESNFAIAGDYVDYYGLFDTVNGKNILIGLTFSLAGMNANVNSQTIEGTVFAMVFLLLLAALCLILIFYFVLRPVKKIQGSIRQYKKHKDSAAVTEQLSKIRSHNEIGQLSDDVADLATEIDDYLERIETITAEKQRISTELDLAKRIQADMMPNIFPPFPDRREFDIFASMDPARGVGGDFYDFFLIDKDHLCLIMADVSGKGIPAALFMMASKIILASCAMMGESAGSILEKTNEAICSNNKEEMFVTVWLGILELSTGKLKAANAGHEYPAIKKPDGEFELLMDKHGFVIGGMDGTKYKEYELVLEPGSKLFVYTDGVPEATNSDNELFGTDRMLEALNKDGSAAPRQILENIRVAVDDFVKDAEQFDDLTMLCVEYKGK